MQCHRSLSGLFRNFDSPDDEMVRPIQDYEAIQLSQAITDRKQLRLVFLDGDTLVESVRWHTPAWIGLRDGKVINKQALKFWEPLDP